MDNRTTFALQPITLNSSNRLAPIQKTLESDCEETQTPAFPILSSDNSKGLEVDQESQIPLATVHHQPS